MAGRSNFSASKDRDAESVAGRERGAEHEHILIETPEETRQAVARIKGYFVDAKKAIVQEKKNPNAVALGRLGGLKSGKVRRARTASRKTRKTKRPA